MIISYSQTTYLTKSTLYTTGSEHQMATTEFNSNTLELTKKRKISNQELHM